MLALRRPAHYNCGMTSLAQKKLTISHQDTLSQALAICKKLGADAADALWVSSQDLSVSHRMGQPENLERAESQALGIRVWVGAKQAGVSTNDFSAAAIEACCSNALSMARAGTDDAFATLAPSDKLFAGSAPALDMDDAAECSEQWLQEQCAQAEDVARQHAAITNSEGAYAGHTRQKVALATSHGFFGSHQSSLTSLSVTVIAGTGDKMERDYAHTTARHQSDLRSAQWVGNLAAERTAARLGARKITSQKLPVVFDPRVSRSLLPQLAGAISGQAIARGTSFLKDAMEKQIFSSGITIIDNPHLPRGLGSKPFDGEGVANQKRALVQNGMLQSWLLDVRSANQLGLATTGHASRSVGGQPHPSSTNLYLEPSHLSPEDLLSQVGNGLYVTDLYGMGINLVTGDYSQGAAGFMIENGKRTFAVSEITIASNLREMFAQLQAANDLTFEYATNAPTLAVPSMMIGGA